MDFGYWYMLPIAIFISILAMSSGVGGATFFAPLLLLGLGLPPQIAIGTGLITEVFGFSSGVISYSRRKLVDYKLAFTLIMVTVPAAVFGSLIAGKVEPDVLKIILGIGLLAVASSFLKTPDDKEKDNHEKMLQKDLVNAKVCLTTREKEKICYTVCNKKEGIILAGIGGLFVGMISTGLGELNGYFLMRRCHVPLRVSVATSVFVVAITALCASTTHFINFALEGRETLEKVFSLVIFTVPGVIVGGQVGPMIAEKVSQKLLESILGVLFLLIAVITIVEVIF